MNQKIKHIQAHPTPCDLSRMQVSYEIGYSRRVHHLPPREVKNGETEPHGAGSFHDPEHHQRLLDRVEDMLRNQ